MPLLNTATKVYKGTSLATKVYRGTTQVWPLAAAYGPDQYIEVTPTNFGPGGYMFGQKFRFLAAGRVTGIRSVVSENLSAGTWETYLFSSAGALLASQDGPAKTAGGWTDNLFSTPVAMVANTTYVAAIWLPASGTPQAYNNGSLAGQTVGDVRRLGNGEDGPHSVFSAAAIRDGFPSTALGATATCALTPVFQKAL